MNIKQVIVLICFTLIEATILIAEPAEEQSQSNDFLSTIKSQGWEIGTEFYSYDYEEPGFMEQKGSFWGIFGSYTNRGWIESGSDQKWMIKLEGQFASGETDYDGMLSDGTPQSVSNLDNHTYDLRLLIGPDYLNENNLSTIYLGLGYRHLFNDMMSETAYGYERESNYLYLPLGINSLNALEDDWSWGWGAEVDFLLYGKQNSNGVPLLGDIENTQDSGYGLRASVKFQKHWEKSDFTIEPFVRYWDIDESDIVNGAIEPANETMEVGIRLCLLY